MNDAQILALAAVIADLRLQLAAQAAETVKLLGLLDAERRDKEKEAADGPR